MARYFFDRIVSLASAVCAAIFAACAPLVGFLEIAFPRAEPLELRSLHSDAAPAVIGRDQAREFVSRRTARAQIRWHDPALAALA